MVYQITFKIHGQEVVIEYSYAYSYPENPFITILSVKKEGVEFLDLILALDSESTGALNKIEKRTEYQISKYPEKIVELIDMGI